MYQEEDKGEARQKTESAEFMAFGLRGEREKGKIEHEGDIMRKEHPPDDATN